MSTEAKHPDTENTADDHGGTEEKAPQEKPDQNRGSVHRTTLSLLLIILLLFTWYLMSDRLTPYTSAARVKAFVVQVTPDVSGYVTKIPVKKNQLINPGDTILQIEKKRFRIGVERAEAALAIAGQEIGADTAAISTAMANLSAAQAQLDEAKAQGARLFSLEKQELVAKAQADEARKLIKTAQAQVNASESELERARQRRGNTDKEDNPRLRAALAALEEARLNLERSTVRSASQGYIGGLKIDEGSYINAGQPAMTFIAVDDKWVEAYMTENQLTRVENGNKVELAFDAFPGQVFEGKVKSSGAGVSTGKKTDFGDLSTVQSNRGWLRDPQRFPVIIEITNYDFSQKRSGGLRVNSQVDVIVYTGDNPFWNTLGKLWIRLVSWFSYAY